MMLNVVLMIDDQDEVLKDFKESPFARDGTAASGWFVLDYGKTG